MQKPSPDLAPEKRNDFDSVSCGSGSCVRVMARLRTREHNRRPNNCSRGLDRRCRARQPNSNGLHGHSLASGGLDFFFCFFWPYFPVRFVCVFCTRSWRQLYTSPGKSHSHCVVSSPLSLCEWIPSIVSTVRSETTRDPPPYITDTYGSQNDCTCVDL